MVKTEAAFFVVTPGRNLAHGIAFSCGFRYDKTGTEVIGWTAWWLFDLPCGVMILLGILIFWITGVP